MTYLATNLALVIGGIRLRVRIDLMDTPDEAPAVRRVMDGNENRTPRTMHIHAKRASR